MLSLYLFNLLPLPHLDGTKLFEELIDMVFEDGPTFMYDVESLEHWSQAPTRRGTWRKRVMRLVHSTVAGILLMYVLLVLMNAKH